MATWGIKLGTYTLGTTAAVKALKIATSRRLNQYPIIRSDVSITPEGKQNPIRLDLSGTLIGSDYTSMRTALSDLRGALESTTQNFYIDDERYIRVVSRNFDYAFIKQDFCNYNLSFTGELPYFLAGTVDSYVVSALSSGVSFPISNAGDVRVPLKFVFRNTSYDTATMLGTTISDVQFENKTLALEFYYRGALSSTLGWVALSNPSFEAWTSGTNVAPDGWTLSAGAVGQEIGTIYLGTYSSKITRSGSDAIINQVFTDPKGISYWQGKTVTAKVWVYADDASSAAIQIYDGLTIGTYSAFHSGGSAWELLTVSYTFPANSTVAGVACRVFTDVSCIFDAFSLSEGSDISGDELVIDGGYDNQNVNKFKAELNGTNAMSAFEGDFMELKAGTNYMEYTGSVGGTMTLYWRKGYYV